MIFGLDMVCGAILFALPFDCAFPRFTAFSGDDDDGGEVNSILDDADEELTSKGELRHEWCYHLDHHSYIKTRLF